MEKFKSLTVEELRKSRVIIDSDGSLVFLLKTQYGANARSYSVCYYFSTCNVCVSYHVAYEHSGDSRRTVRKYLESFGLKVNKIS